jgi:signal transduction histidine kinase
VAVTQRADKVRVSVTDHGSGVPDANHDRIFMPFADTEPNDRGSRGGAGLGLSIAKAIIEKHGGQIDFITEPDAGACFFFELPILQKQHDAQIKRVAGPRSR